MQLRGDGRVDTQWNNPDFHVPAGFPPHRPGMVRPRWSASFAVTSLPDDQGFGLFAVLDYRDRLPGYQIPASVFDKPALCRAPGRSARAETRKCSSCHFGEIEDVH
jgi:hypothetical protein